MTEERLYPLSREYLCNIVCDIIELQKGKNVTSDTALGQIGFTTRMYGVRHKYDFEITKEGDNCRVRLTAGGEGSNGAKRLRMMFALMESMMAG